MSADPARHGAEAATRNEPESPWLTGVLNKLFQYRIKIAWPGPGGKAVSTLSRPVRAGPSLPTPADHPASRGFHPPDREQQQRRQDREDHDTGDELTDRLCLRQLLRGQPASFRTGMLRQDLQGNANCQRHRPMPGQQPLPPPKRPLAAVRASLRGGIVLHMTGRADHARHRRVLLYQRRPIADPAAFDALHVTGVRPRQSRGKTAKLTTRQVSATLAVPGAGIQVSTEDRDKVPRDRTPGDPTCRR